MKTKKLGLLVVGATLLLMTELKHPWIRERKKSSYSRAPAHEEDF